MLKHAVLAAGVGLALPAHAGWYEVEVLVFARATPEALQGEAWPEAVPVPAAADAMDILAPALDEAALELPAPAGEAAAEQPYRLLPDSALQLQSAKARLAQAGYQPLVHLAWRQDAAAPTAALPLRIYGGTNYAPAAPLLPAGVDPAAAVPAAAAAVLTPPEADATIKMDIPEAEAAPLPAPVWQMEGVLRLSGASQPDFSADLVLRLPAAAAPDAVPGSAPALRLYALQASRRLKNQEIHYLDHPLMGALVQLRPYEPPAASAGAPAMQPVPPENKP